jgi:hypothetical protein
VRPGLVPPRNWTVKTGPPAQAPVLLLVLVSVPAILKMSPLDKTSLKETGRESDEPFARAEGGQLPASQVVPPSSEMPIVLARVDTDPKHIANSSPTVKVKPEIWFLIRPSSRKNIARHSM